MRLMHVLSVVGCLTVALCPRPGRAGEGEKVLFGFERAEIEKAVRGQPDYSSRVLDNGDVDFFITRSIEPVHELEMVAIRPMRCVQEKASAGKYACKIEAALDNNVRDRPAFLMPRLGAWPLQTGQPQANLRRGELFNTSGWFSWVFPQDWSGYDLLRMDVRIETGQAVKLMLEVEDDLVEPPVSLTFDGPATGKWVTLEMDLAKAAEERKLNLKAMENVWLRVDFCDLDKLATEWEELRQAGNKEELAKRTFVAYVDNIRLCKKGTACANPVLAGVRSAYTATLPRSYAAEEVHRKRVQLYPWPDVVPADARMPAEAKLAPLAAPVALAPPSVIPIKQMLEAGRLDDKALDEVAIKSFAPQVRQPADYNSVRLACAAAADPKHVIVGFYVFTMNSLRADATAERPVARSCTAAVATTDGGATWKGLDGTAWPTVLGGNVTKGMPKPVDLGGNIMGAYSFGCGGMVSAHIGYPMDRVFFVRTVFTGDGWWKSPKYFVSGEPRHCHWVEWGDQAGSPSGRIWAGWTARDRSSYGHAFKIETYATTVYYSDDGGASWCSWRGPGLSGLVDGLGGRAVGIAPYRGGVAVFAGENWTWFDGKRWAPVEGTGVRCRGVVACGDELYLLDENGPARCYDGKQWQDFAPPGRTGKGGRVGVCGWKTAVFVEPDAGGRKLLCWRKTAGGRWQGPAELLSEQTPIVQLAVQRYAPEGFLPVAYMCQAAEEAAGKAGAALPRPARGNLPAFPGIQPVQHTVHQPWIKLLLAPATPTAG